MKIAKYFARFVFLVVLPIQAIAAPVTYTFTGNWTNSSTGDFGASYIATLILDNGGSSAANQTFGQSDFVSARLESGTYDFTMAASNITNWQADFSSNASGQLIAGWFDASDADNNWHFDLDFVDANFSDATGSGSFFQEHVSNPGTVGVAAAAAPVPTMSLYGLMLTMFGVLVLAIRRL